MQFLSQKFCWLFVISIHFFFLNLPTTFAQSGLEDDRVLIQGFFWESYRHGHSVHPEFGSQRWYEIVADQAAQLRDARFDMIWLPPPSYAGWISAGYNPKEYYNLSNSYGSIHQHRKMLEALLANGVEPIADLVFNHRDGLHGWADFKNPDWGPWAITREDEAFYHPDSEVYQLPMEQRGSPECRPTEYTQHGGTCFAYDAFRDIDHENEQVRSDLVCHLLQLKSFGYRGWRYDMVHGFHARWVAYYNRMSQPTFSVGEYDWDKQSEQRGWVWHSATRPGDWTTSSHVFDFMSFFALKDNKGRYDAWYGWNGSGGLGLLGDWTDGIPWKNRAVTFLENHDTGYRTNPDGSPQFGHQFDNFQNNWEVEQGYAYILTHPGVPTVYWKHYFDWGPDLREKIKALINARKIAGVHSGSPLFTQQNARQRGVYAAQLFGRFGQLFVRIGGSDADWTPAFSGFSSVVEFAQGSGWKVWIQREGVTEVIWAPENPALPIPSYEFEELE